MAQKNPTITAQPRERLGSRYTQRLRRGGRLPGVIYGHKLDPMPIHIDEKEILTLLQHGAHVLNVTVEGGKTETCLVKELQFGYLGDNVIHVDFARVKLDEEVRVLVHLNFVGESPATQKTGAILNHDLMELEVICKVNAIPEEIRVDLSQLETIMTVGQIDLPQGVRSTADSGIPVAHISFVHREEPEAEEVEVVAETAEPEVITGAKPESEQTQEKES